jgi:hypothetical protein
MPSVVAALPPEDYTVMGYAGHDGFNDDVYSIVGPPQRFIVNATRRLADVDWLSGTLDEQVRRDCGPSGPEGLLSLQMYLLLTCADTLGHISHPKYGTRGRFRGFFLGLPASAWQSLADAFLVWNPEWQELLDSDLIDAETGSPIVAPDRIRTRVTLLSPDARHEAIIDFLYYVRRNPYTHEAEYPQLGHHPNLYVLQQLRLGVESVATHGEVDRTQAVAEGSRCYFVYYGTDDPIASLRRVILMGLGAITRAQLPG